MLCPFCQSRNPKTATICRGCGSPLAGVSVTVPPRQLTASTQLQETASQPKIHQPQRPQPYKTTVAYSAPSSAPAPPALQCVLRGHSSRIIGVAFWGDGSQVAVAGEDGAMHLWDARNGKPAGVPLRASKKMRDIRCVAFARQAQSIASGHEDGTVWLRGSGSNRGIHALKSHEGCVNTLAFSTDETLLASGGRDGAIIVWDVANGQRRKMLIGNGPGVTALAFSPEADLLASGDDSGAVHLWVLAEECIEWTRTEHTFWINTLAFAPNGNALASGGYDQTARVWAARSGFELQLLSGHDTSVNSVAFGSDSRILASGSADGTVRLWDSWTGTLRHTLPATSGAVDAIAFSPGCPDGSTMLACATGSEVCVWQLDASANTPF
jgi:WD40 repeat protein